MQSIACLTIISSLLWSAMDTSTLNRPPLAMSATCEGSKECVFAGKSVWIQVVFTNKSSRPVGIPWEYLRKRGTYVTLVDNTSARKLNLPVSRPSPQLRQQLTFLQPSGSLSFAVEISSRHITHFNKNLVGLTALIDVGIEAHLDDGSTQSIEPETLLISGHRDYSWPLID